MTIEGWVIICIGALMWWALANRAQRIERVLTQIRALLGEVLRDGKLAPWVANQPEPHISEQVDRPRKDDVG